MGFLIIPTLNVAGHAPGRRERVTGLDRRGIQPRPSPTLMTATTKCGRRYRAVALGRRARHFAALPPAQPSVTRAPTPGTLWHPGSATARFADSAGTNA